MSIAHFFHYETVVRFKPLGQKLTVLIDPATGFVSYTGVKFQWEMVLDEYGIERDDLYRGQTTCSSSRGLL